MWQVHIFITGGMYYVLVLTIIGALPPFLPVAAIMARLTGMHALFFTWRFTRKLRTGN